MLACQEKVRLLIVNTEFMKITVLSQTESNRPVKKPFCLFQEKIIVFLKNGSLSHLELTCPDGNSSF